MKRNFEEWIQKFESSIFNYKYYVDFNKICENASKIRVELYILNSLVGSENIEEEFVNIILRYPDTLECIPLLLAVRSQDIYVKDDVNDYLFNFKEMVYSVEDYVKFMRETGLFNLI